MSQDFLSAQTLEAFFRSMNRRAWSHTATIRIARIEGDREVSNNGASGVLLQFPHLVAVATANHVVELYEKYVREGQHVVLLIDNMPIAHPTVVHRDLASDVALIEVPEQGREGLHTVPYRPSLMWPPPRVSEGDTVFLLGFPTSLRIPDPAEIVHGDIGLMLTVKRSYEDSFTIHMDHDEIEQRGRVEVALDQDFGGASGGPVFLINNEGNPLVGVVSESGFGNSIWRVGSLANIPSAISRIQDRE